MLLSCHAMYTMFLSVAILAQARRVAVVSDILGVGHHGGGEEGYESHEEGGKGRGEAAYEEGYESQADDVTKSADACYGETAR